MRWLSKRERGGWGGEGTVAPPRFSTIFVVLIFMGMATSAFSNTTEERDILDRLDVREILEGIRRDTSEDSDTFYLLEVTGDAKTFEGGMYGVWEMLPLLHSQIGFSYRDNPDPEFAQSFMKVYLFALFRAYMFQPMLGIGGAYGLLDRREARFFTEAFLGARFQLTKMFAFSLKQSLRLSSLAFLESEDPSIYRAAEKTIEIAFQVQL